MPRPSAPLLAVLVAALLTGCGSATARHPSASASPPLQGLTLSQSKPPPPLALRNYTGEPVSLSRLRGKAVLVTFLYTHCPDWCPLILANLAAAQRQLGPQAQRLRIVAVTVDPSRDTPAAIRAFLAKRGATARVDYLLGTPAQLLRTWRAWGVAVALDAHHRTAGHSDIVYGITASGKMTVIYPPSFTPAQIVHDVPVLARS